jgi:hypothetical protein
MFKLLLGKEIRKLMNLVIPMGHRNHYKEGVEVVKGCGEKYAQATKLLE